MASFDRTQIVGLLKGKWPELETMLSSEVQAFLNDLTKTNVTDDMPNANAFDMWRQALARQGYPEFWRVTQARIDEIQRRSREMKAEEEKRAKEAREKYGDGIPETA